MNQPFHPGFSEDESGPSCFFLLQLVTSASLTSDLQWRVCFFNCLVEGVHHQATPLGGLDLDLKTTKPPGSKPPVKRKVSSCLRKSALLLSLQVWVGSIFSWATFPSEFPRGPAQLSHCVLLVVRGSLG